MQESWDQGEDIAAWVERQASAADAAAEDDEEGGQAIETGALPGRLIPIVAITAAHTLGRDPEGPQVGFLCFLPCMGG